MNNKVIELLKEYGPMLSGELAHIYEREYHASNVAARQALSRVGKPVNKICTLSFDKNQKFFYLESQYMSVNYVDRLMEAIQESSHINWIYIRAFQSQYGFVSKDILPALVASPVKNVQGHKLHKRVIEDLLKCNIIEEYDEDRWKLSDWIPIPIRNLTRSTGLEVVKKQIVNDFAKWAGNLNLAGYHSSKTFTASAEFANFRWAYTAPSYIQPLYDMNHQTNGFIVADVFYGRTATAEDIRFFVEKLAIIRNFKNLQNVLPVLLVERVSQEALEILKEQKVVIAIISNLFDERYTELLAEIVNVFTNASAIVSKNPGQIKELFERLSKEEGRFNDIIGDMFELMVGYYYRKIGCEFLEIGKEIHIPEMAATNELDLLIQKDGSIIVVECKATRNAVDRDFAEKWLNKNIPQTRRWLNERYPEIGNFEFQLWSLGGYTAEALELLRNAAGMVKKYTITFYDRKQIIDLFKEGKVQIMLDMLRQHFDEHETFATAP